MKVAELEIRVESALQIANDYGGIDGGHHKMWVIDQMVRALTGCPIIRIKDVDHKGVPFSYQAYGESEDYMKFVEEHCTGDDGPETYDWDVGIPP